jgi:mono/diheme cytochrome c family protein
MMGSMKFGGDHKFVLKLVCVNPNIRLMKRLPLIPSALPLAVVALAAAAMLGGFAINSLAEDAKADARSETKPADKQKAEKKLTGAELYAVNCNRCHPERYPTEFNSAQWQTIMLHMRVRANLPAAQAREILKYMKEESGR